MIETLNRLLFYYDIETVLTHSIHKIIIQPQEFDRFNHFKTHKNLKSISRNIILIIFQVFINILKCYYKNPLKTGP